MTLFKQISKASEHQHGLHVSVWGIWYMRTTHKRSPFSIVFCWLQYVFIWAAWHKQFRFSSDISQETATNKMKRCVLLKVTKQIKHWKKCYESVTQWGFEELSHMKHQLEKAIHHLHPEMSSLQTVRRLSRQPCLAQLHQVLMFGGDFKWSASSLKQHDVKLTVDCMLHSLRGKVCTKHKICRQKQLQIFLRFRLRQNHKKTMSC